MTSFELERAQMVGATVAGRGITDPLVLLAMLEVPRHLFVARADLAHSYDDAPQGIGEGQTISQPYIVAWMLQAAQVTPRDKLLEVGCGSGYAAAVASWVAKKVFTIERHQSLAEQAKARLAALGYVRAQVRHGDGMLGWPEEAPFDVILVAAGAASVPPALLAQLAPGGRLVMPIGPRNTQQLIRFTRGPGGEVESTTLGAVTFVPLLPGTERLSG